MRPLSHVKIGDISLPFFTTHFGSSNMKLIVPPTPPSPLEALTKDVIQHLSKEIETTTNSMMAFRTRIGFGLLVGPFLLLGSLS
jgi:hypothetical protein